MSAPQDPRLEDVKLELLLGAVARGVPQTMIARGSSMWPALLSGDRVELSPPTFPIPIGTVVAVRSDDRRFLIHRLCGVRADGAMLLKGDHCPKPDGWFEPHEVVAVVNRVERQGDMRPVMSAAAARSRGVALRTRVVSLVQRLRRWGRMCAAGGRPRRDGGPAH